MKIFFLYWHPEPQSFNGALFCSAQEALTAAGHEAMISDLHEMNFEPVSSRLNFTTIKDEGYLKPQLEEIYATHNDGFAPRRRGYCSSDGIRPEPTKPEGAVGGSGL